MSGLYNLKVNNVAAEDIICNGETMEEVWVDGVQVFDAYDPDSIPGGTLNFYESGNYPTSNADASSAREWRAPGQTVGYAGYINLFTNDCRLNGTVDGSVRGIDSVYTAGGQQLTNWGGAVTTNLEIRYSDGTPLFGILSIDRGEHLADGDELRVYGATGEINLVRLQDRRHGGDKEARVSWNFKTKKVTVSGTNFTQTTYDLSQKWKEGMYVYLRRTASSNLYNGYYIADSPNSAYRISNAYAHSNMNATAKN